MVAIAFFLRRLMRHEALKYGYAAPGLVVDRSGVLSIHDWMTRIDVVAFVLAVLSILGP